MTHKKMNPPQPVKSHFENLPPYLTTSDLNYYSYQNTVVYIEMFTRLKQAHDYDYCSYAE